MQLLHTMIRVNDMDESIKFYTDALGMKLLRQTGLSRREVHPRLCWLWG